MIFMVISSRDSFLHAAHCHHLFDEKNEEKSKCENQVTNRVIGRKSFFDLFANFRNHVKDTGAEKYSSRETVEVRN